MALFFDMDPAVIAKHREDAIGEIKAAADAAVLEAARIKFLGRNGMLPQIMKSLKDVAPAARAEAGRQANEFKVQVSAAYEARVAALSGPAGAGGAGGFDVTLPGRWRGIGRRHPISMVVEDVIRILGAVGFKVADGPDVETKFNNFDALNTPEHHPSLDAKDTFWFDSDLLLRTQTSPVQIRVMLAHKPPVRIITPGRCYRRDTMDATHSASFHQVEGLYVDRNVSLADLKGVLAYFAREMMGPDVKVRLRPHFFPFTEPSVECDFSCHLCHGKGCRVCKQSGWIEIAGAGMVDPRVFEKVGYDPESSGYAFGMGLERIAMVKYGIEDIRMFYENDLRFLEQFR